MGSWRQAKNQTSHKQQTCNDNDLQRSPRLACISLGSCLEIELGRDSNVYPLFLNPFDVTHWKCLGWTVYENTEKSALYTYDIDVCFAAVLAAKLGFPWIYEYITGRNFFQAVGLTSRSDQQEFAYDYDYAAEQYQSPESFSEKASASVHEMSKAVHRDPNPYSTINRYNRFPKQF